MKGFMRFSKIQLKKAIGCALAAAVIAAGTSPLARALNDLPDLIVLTEGYTARIELPPSVTAQMSDAYGDSVCALSGMDQSLEGTGALELTGNDVGSARMVLSLLGIKIKTVNVDVQPERTLIPGGQLIGVAIHTDGLMVVGASDIGETPSPARIAGLRAGDVIMAINGQKVDSAAQMGELFDGAEAELSVMRDGKECTVRVTPIKDERDGVYRLGAWVRDSTAGVGTLSFYDPQTHAFGALGHAITDVDTGEILSVGRGYIYNSHLIDILRGQSGEPGELLGEFFDQESQLGEVTENCVFGLYGHSEQGIENALYPEGVKVMARSEVKPGPATLLTTIGDKGIGQYDCEIVKVFHQDAPSQRSMVVRITDGELLEATGGIVQGMSGSPILQDGRLVGAITHVYIDDPTQGYAIFAEWMLDQLQTD